MADHPVGSRFVFPELVRVPALEADLDALLAFLATLTDEGSIAGRMGIPAEVPSGLPVDR